MAGAERERRAIAAMHDRLVALVEAQLQQHGYARAVVCGPADLGTVEPALAQLRVGHGLLLFCDPALRTGALEVT